MSGWGDPNHDIRGDMLRAREMLDSAPAYDLAPLPVLSPKVYARAQAEVPQRDGEPDRYWWNRVLNHAAEQLGVEGCERLLGEMYPHGLI